MKNTKHTLRRSILAVVLSLAAVGATGCAGDPLVRGEGSPLLSDAAAPLPPVAEGALDTAPPDCAGRLTNVQASNFRFELASLSAGLVAVVDSMGDVVCVDSLSDVSSDLDASGQSSDADALVASFLAASHAAEARPEVFLPHNYAGDPEPQPNNRPGAIPDPEPQPN